MSSDLLVVGWDLIEKQEVLVDDAPVATWRAKSYQRGNNTLICLYCYRGIDAAEGTRIPLIVRYREGGERRAHFAHPPGMAPIGGHAPESLWHIEAKHRLAHWARTLPNVVSAIPEQYTSDRSRRADVHITLDDGTRIALELQATALHDDDWRARHADYERQGIIDVWLWHPNLRTPWMCAKDGLPIWQLNLDQRTITAAVGRSHPRRRDWYTDADLARYAEHLPPCVGDSLTWWTSLWNQFGLGPAGLRIPDGWADELRRNAEKSDAAAQRARDLAAARAALLQPPPQQRPPRDGSTVRMPTAEPLVDAVATATDDIVAPADSAAARPDPRTPSSDSGPVAEPDPWSIPVGGPRCDICHEKLVYKWIPYGRHRMCDEDQQRRASRPTR